jgi:hypothetical protein
MEEEHEARVKVSAFIFESVRRQLFANIAPHRDTVCVFADGCRKIVSLDTSQPTRCDRKVRLSIQYFGRIKVCSSRETAESPPYANAPVVLTRQRTRWMTHVHTGELALTYVIQNGRTGYEMELEFEPVRVHDRDAAAYLQALIDANVWTEGVVQDFNLLFCGRSIAYYLTAKFNQPITAHDSVPLDTAEYVKTIKHDGTRSFLYVNTTKSAAYALTPTRVTKLPTVPTWCKRASIYDTELIGEITAIVAVPIDVLVYKGKCVTELPGTARLAMCVYDSGTIVTPTDGFVYKLASAPYMSPCFKVKFDVSNDFLVCGTVLYVTARKGLIPMPIPFEIVNSTEMHRALCCSETGVCEFVCEPRGPCAQPDTCVKLRFTRLRNDKLQPNYIDVVLKNMAPFLPSLNYPRA